MAGTHTQMMHKHINYTWIAYKSQKIVERNKKYKTKQDVCKNKQLEKKHGLVPEVVQYFAQLRLRVRRMI